VADSRPGQTEEETGMGYRSCERKTICRCRYLDRWEDPNSDLWLESYAIVTCAASPSIRHLHDRMPVILHKADEDRWLEPGDPNNPPVDLLVPFPDELIKAWRIKPDVGNVRNNRPDLIDPIDPTDPVDPTLF
jgi:putative SOS response-associated peptidase YedK